MKEKICSWKTRKEKEREREEGKKPLLTKWLEWRWRCSSEEGGKGQERRRNTQGHTRLDDFLRRHPRTGIGETRASCNQFLPPSPRLPGAHKSHRVMQYNMWKRVSPSNPMSSHPHSLSFALKHSKSVGCTPTLPRKLSRNVFSQVSVSRLLMHFLPSVVSSSFFPSSPLIEENSRGEIFEFIVRIWCPVWNNL